MFVIKRNQVIVTALVVMVAVAGYLNFTESRGSESVREGAVVLTEEGDAYSALLENNDITSLADDYDEDMDLSTANIDPVTAEVVAEGDEGSAVFVSAEASDTYFVQAKLEREQARAKQKDILTEMLNNTNISENDKSETAKNMLDIQKRIEKETAAEAMIKSKGFGEAYVRIDDETVDVVVEKPELTDAEIAQIMDIVKRKAGVSEDKIRISPLKK